MCQQGWFGGKKMKAAIGFDRVVEILHKFQAPQDVSQSSNTSLIKSQYQCNMS